MLWNIVIGILSCIEVSDKDERWEGELETRDVGG